MCQWTWKVYGQQHSCGGTINARQVFSELQGKDRYCGLPGWGWRMNGYKNAHIENPWTVLAGLDQFRWPSGTRWESMEEHGWGSQGLHQAVILQGERGRGGEERMMTVMGTTKCSVCPVGTWCSSVSTCHIASVFTFVVILHRVHKLARGHKILLSFL
jgi:hypothetical protein